VKQLLYTWLYNVTFEGVYEPGISGGIWRVSPRWYFLVFFKIKNDSKSGTVHAGIDAVEQARTCAGSSAAMLQEFESWLYPKI
jgi:hypothetical protein